MNVISIAKGIHNLWTHWIKVVAFILRNYVYMSSSFFLRLLRLESFMIIWSKNLEKRKRKNTSFKEYFSSNFQTIQSNFNFMLFRGKKWSINFCFCAIFSQNVLNKINLLKWVLFFTISDNKIELQKPLTAKNRLVIKTGWSKIWKYLTISNRLAVVNWTKNIF
jgi:hypothetical protein